MMFLCSWNKTMFWSGSLYQDPCFRVCFHETSKNGYLGPCFRTHLMKSQILNKGVMILAFMFFMFLSFMFFMFIKRETQISRLHFPECGHRDHTSAKGCGPRPGWYPACFPEIRNSVLTPNTCFALSWFSFEGNVENIYTHANLF